MPYNKEIAGKICGKICGIATSKRVHIGSQLNLSVLSSSELLSNFTSVVGLWPMDDASAPFQDYSSNNNDLPITGTISAYQVPTTVKDKVAVKFDNRTGDIYATDSQILNAFNEEEGFFSFWVKPNTDDAFQKDTGVYIFNFTGDSSNRIWLRCTNTYLACYHYGSGTSKSISMGLPRGDRWVNIGIGWSKINGYLKGYVNGVVHVVNNTALGAWSVSVASLRMFGLGYTNSRINVQVFDAILTNYAPTDQEVHDSVNPNGVICFVGDSRSSGKGWTLKAAESYKAGAFSANKYGIAEEGYSGYTPSGLLGVIATANSRKTGINDVLVFWAGVNDSGNTVANIYANIEAYCDAAKAAGWHKVIVCTEIDAGLSGWSTKYLELNQLLRADYSFADGLIDLGAKTELQDHTNLTYFSVDGTHLVAAGYEIVAETISEGLKNYMLF